MAPENARIPDRARRRIPAHVSCSDQTRLSMRAETYNSSESTHRSRTRRIGRRRGRSQADSASTRNLRSFGPRLSGEFIDSQHCIAYSNRAKLVCAFLFGTSDIGASDAFVNDFDNHSRIRLFRRLRIRDDVSHEPYCFACARRLYRVCSSSHLSFVQMRAGFISVEAMPAHGFV